jgi:hypothetical protein
MLALIIGNLVGDQLNTNTSKLVDNYVLYCLNKIQRV